MGYTKGIWNGAVGLVTFVKDVAVKGAEIASYLSPIEGMNDAVSAAYKSYYNGELSSAQWKESFANNLNDEKLKDIAAILGIDANL